METIVQWATILSPIIAVVIAVWASRKSAKDTAQQIAVMEENNKKQLESVKRLCLLQLSAAYDSLEMSLYEYSLGKENDNLELRSLRAEMDQLQKQQEINPLEIVKLKNKMEKLSKNVEYKGNFEMTIMMKQFRIVEEIEKFKNLVDGEVGKRIK
jgi:hypothetical protein